MSYEYDVLTPNSNVHDGRALRLESRSHCRLSPGRARPARPTHAQCAGCRAGQRGGPREKLARARVREPAKLNLTSLLVLLGGSRVEG